MQGSGQAVQFTSHGTGTAVQASTTPAGQSPACKVTRQDTGHVKEHTVTSLLHTSSAGETYLRIVCSTTEADGKSTPELSHTSTQVYQHDVKVYTSIVSSAFHTEHIRQENALCQTCLMNFAMKKPIVSRST